ncbi:hypothetical protein K4L06_14625 [Lysobacter sp. BMK333-48F3]|uniref:hypothetical protein n=1 Tax=Lysobacter sp. BMK333-48F3 TaxID=2867962 RepID=UPI001C8B27EE|nr:hypothetical protein [Lysobacter sp. BMK333-48F3]MBX9402542.1 hypothetical protein [Lysobacter sp. BMK333-48F3]
MTIWKKTLLGAATVCLLVLGAGYLTAWQSLDACTDDTFQDLQRKGIRGRDMTGDPVAMTRDTVSATVVGPFLVETYYMVPFNLHGSLHIKRYLVLPWGRYERSAEVVILVAAPHRPRDSNARPPFQPMPLRGPA